MIFEIYSCLNNKSTLIAEDNVVEQSIFDNYYSLWHNNTVLTPINDFNMCYVPKLTNISDNNFG